MPVISGGGVTGDTLEGRAAIVIAALQSEASERHQEERGERGLG